MVQLKIPDPKFTQSDSAKKNLALAIRLSLWIVGIVWLFFIADQLLNLELRQFGLRPRSVSGLVGVATVPLIHSGLPHIFHNTIPLLVGSIALLYLYPNAALRVLPVLYAGTSLLAWTFARPNLHIGASGMVYGMLTFVFVSGLLRRDLRSIGVSLLLWFLYGSMVWGLFPTRPGMSWELHLSGAIMGLLSAIIFRHWDQVPVKRYEWEDDDEVPEWYLKAQERLENSDDEGA